jgi:hypothetical protein
MLIIFVVLTLILIHYMYTYKWCKVAKFYILSLSALPELNNRKNYCVSLSIVGYNNIKINHFD